VIQNLISACHSKNATAFAWNWHKNSHLDDLLEEGMVTIDPKRRCAIYEEVRRSSWETRCGRGGSLFLPAYPQVLIACPVCG
jgi:hypothetical protein